MKKWIVLLLAVFAAAGLFPAAAFAEESYALWVGGAQVTQSNKDDIAAAINAITQNAASGRAAFDPDTNTLTLDNFTCAGEGYVFNSSDYGGKTGSAAVYSGLDTLYITVKGTNSLRHARNDGNSYGLYTAGSLVITGESTGTLTAESCETSLSNTRSVGVYVKEENITVNGGAVTGIGGNTPIEPGTQSMGVWCLSGDITVNQSGQLTGIGGSGNISRGVCVAGALAVNGGTANGTAGTGGSISHGISMGNLKSGSESSRITGEAGKATGNMSSAESAGLVIWGASAFSRGAVTGAADEAPQGQSHGMLLRAPFTVGGGTVIAQGKNGAFSRAPVIASGFSDAGIWYGETEAEANVSGARDKSVLAEKYAQKYVRISRAGNGLYDVPDTGDDSRAGLWFALMIIALAGLAVRRAAWRAGSTRPDASRRPLEQEGKESPIMNVV